MTWKDTYFVKIQDYDNPNVFGVGECPLFNGLSKEDTPEYEFVAHNLCDEFCKSLNRGEYNNMYLWPSSLRFGLESAYNDLNNGGRGLYFDSPWLHGDSKPITINGLIWMGNKQLMFERIKQKLDEGFRCLKLKIGGIDFDDELNLIKYIRQSFSEDVLQLRLDANGAFNPVTALDRLDKLSEYKVHSIEQPIAAGMLDEMQAICAKSPIPIALDEELIGTRNIEEMQQLVNYIKPSYIILKPALCGGFIGAREYIEIAENLGIGYWVTSALESNIGLSAIAQFVATIEHDMPQGLGTGQLYTNNFECPLELVSDKLHFNENKLANFDLSACTLI